MGASRRAGRSPAWALPEPGCRLDWDMVQVEGQACPILGWWGRHCPQGRDGARAGTEARAMLRGVAVGSGGRLVLASCWPRAGCVFLGRVLISLSLGGSVSGEAAGPRTAFPSALGTRSALASGHLLGEAGPEG